MRDLDETLLSSGQLAAESGVSPDTLRHYERLGVLDCPERSANGYRRYPRAALKRVRMIRSALAVGFTLDELAGIFHERDAGDPPCRRVHAMATAKLVDVERRIAELTALRQTMRDLVASWGATLAGTPPGQAAYLLEGLTAKRVSGQPTLPTATRLSRDSFSGRKERS